MKLQITETMNIRQAHDTICSAVKAYHVKDEYGRYRLNRRRARPICLMGPAGIGKTEVVKQVAEELDLPFLSYSITHHTRQSLIGLPQLTSLNANGTEFPITQYTTSEIIADVLRTGKEEGILFLDEFNCASETIRPIMLQLLQDKSLGGHTLPEGWILVLAGNPGEYNRTANEIDAVTADRLRMIHIEPNLEVWMEYAIRQGVHPAITSFLESNPQHFYRFEKTGEGAGIVTARGWEDLSFALLQAEEFKEPVTLGLVAQFIQLSETATEFENYYSIYREYISGNLMKRFMDNKLTLADRKKLSGMSENRKMLFMAAVKSVLSNQAKAAAAIAKTVDDIHFYLRLRQKHWGVGTDVEESVPNKLASDWLVQNRHQSFEEVKQAFQKGPAAEKESSMRQAGEMLTSILLATAEVFGDGPQIELLLLGINADKNWVRVLSENRNEVYRELCNKTFFEEEKETSLEELLNA